MYQAPTYHGIWDNCFVLYCIMHRDCIVPSCDGQGHAVGAFGKVLALAERPRSIAIRHLAQERKERGCNRDGSVGLPPSIGVVGVESHVVRMPKFRCPACHPAASCDRISLYRERRVWLHQWSEVVM